MNFDFDDEHVALRDAVRRFCDSEYPRHLRGTMEPPHVEQSRWSRLSALGLTGVAISTDLGGSGRGAVDTMVVAHELGRALAAGSYASQVVLAGQLIALCGDEDQHKLWLAPVAAGTLRLSPAIDEDGMRHDIARTGLLATRDAQDWLLAGHKSSVIGGAQADAFVVLARSQGAANAREDFQLFVVNIDTPGLHVKVHDTLDGRQAVRLRFDQVRLPDRARLIGADSVWDAVQAALDAANAALVAEAAGAMDALVDLCCEHLRTRTQFGSPLAKFQVLQHRIADMVMTTEQIDSMAAVAAMAVDAGNTAQRRRIVSAAKALAARWGRELGWQAIQIHGAMGMTDDCSVGHYTKRLLQIGQMLGDHIFHLARMGDRSTSETPHPQTPA